MCMDLLRRLAGCMEILQNFSMHAFSIFYVHQKFRMHAWMQHGKLSSTFNSGQTKAPSEHCVFFGTKKICNTSENAAVNEIINGRMNRTVAENLWKKSNIDAHLYETNASLRNILPYQQTQKFLRQKSCRKIFRRPKFRRFLKINNVYN